LSSPVLGRVLEDEPTTRICELVDGVDAELGEKKYDGWVRAQ
jgi:hypothetical protein